MKARRSTVVITDEVAAVIKGMVRRGDRQMDVAVFHAINQGRVNEIVRGTRSGKKYAHVQPAPIDKLPEPGPYVIVSRVTHDKGMVAQGMVSELRLLLERYSAVA